MTNHLSENGPLITNYRVEQLSVQNGPLILNSEDLNKFFFCLNESFQAFLPRMSTNYTQSTIMLFKRLRFPYELGEINSLCLFHPISHQLLLRPHYLDEHIFGSFVDSCGSRVSGFYTDPPFQMKLTQRQTHVSTHASL